MLLQYFIYSISIIIYVYTGLGTGLMEGGGGLDMAVDG